MWARLTIASRHTMINSAVDADLDLPRPNITPTLPADDPQFIGFVRRAVVGELEAKPVHGLFVIRINNWFDHKWLNYSAIGRVAYGQTTDVASCNPDTAL